ncbi:MAG: hypothetical protein QG637_57 [Chloroflexota bacterium]|nr:hypothetical protein [Chloroflexota bacterium]
MASDAPLRRPWTLMVYMAGDNGKVFSTQYGKLKLMAEMTSAGYNDLAEMGTIGTTDNVAVTCLFDTNQDASYLVEVRRDGRGLAGSRCRRMQGVNMGAPNTLSEFIVESIRLYPAEHYALVIWNHGTGWLDVDAYATVRALGAGRPVFHRTPIVDPDGMTRPIAFDDSSKDFLDTADLRQAFAEAQAATGVRLDLIGMDACLMAMVEGACELADFADFFVGSQEIEPMDGWPYAPILAALNGEPGMAPGKVAELVVREFARAYRATTRLEETITQSAIDLRRAAQTVALCKALVDAISAQADAALRGMVKGLLTGYDSVLVFQDRNYRDLGDFALKLARKTEFGDYTAVSAAAKALYDHLQARGPEAAVLQVAFRPKYRGANGLSVFLPPKLRDVLPIYQGLKFPQATGWDKLLAWLFDDFSAQWPA